MPKTLALTFAIAARAGVTEGAAVIHAMNSARRDAFDLMRRQNAKYARKSGPMLTYFEREVMGSSMSNALEDLGWLTRSPGRNGRLTTITLTDFGLWVLGGAPPSPSRCADPRP